MSIEFLSTVPELPKTVLSGDGLTTAVAGKRTPISIRLFDQFDNPATPPPAWTVGLAITNSKKKPVTAERIIELTGEMFGFEIEQITGGSRRRPLVDARQIAMYVTRNMTDLSFPDIGNEFGNRDHTTVMHACRKIEARMGERQQIFDKVTELQHRLNESS